MPKSSHNRPSARSKRRAILIVVVYVIFMIALAVVAGRFVDKESLHSLVERTGALGVFLFFLIEYLYVVFVPIYNTAIHIAAGLIFGGMMGWAINFVATTLGLLTILLLVMRFGGPLIRRVIPMPTMKRYEHIIDRYGPIALFVIYVLPFFPDDEMTYIIAIGERSGIWRYVLPALLGNLAKTSTSFIGAEGAQGALVSFGARGVVLGIGVILIGIQEVLLYYRKRYKSSKQ